jgi:hypothetical protein
MNEWSRQVGVVALALALGCSLFGCNPWQSSRVSPAKVRGKVTYKEQPLPGGFLHFFNGTNYVGTAVIMPDGSGDYEASVPAIPVQVLVTGEPRPAKGDTPAESGSATPPRRPKPSLGRAFGATQAKLLDEVQKKYGSLKTAKPLTLDVAPGEQTWNLNLD